MDVFGDGAMKALRIWVVVSDVINAALCSLGTADAKVITVADGVEWDEVFGPVGIVAKLPVVIVKYVGNWKMVALNSVTG